MVVAATKSSMNSHYDGPALRVARCIPTLSRRQAEQAVLMGRVKVDGTVVDAPSYRLFGGQQLTLDNQKVEWESKAKALLLEGQGPHQTTRVPALEDHHNRLRNHNNNNNNNNNHHLLSTTSTTNPLVSLEPWTTTIDGD
jgi:ribosomal protein S4